MAIAAANAAREASLPQLKQRSGVVVQQPDGTEEIAITVERISGEACYPWRASQMSLLPRMAVPEVLEPVCKCPMLN